MKDGWMQRLMDNAALSEESVPGRPVLELLGDGRILIENHRGICQYGPEQIKVQVCFGIISIVGRNLHLGQMTCHKLVILGKIDTILVERGKC